MVEDAGHKAKQLVLQCINGARIADIDSCSRTLDIRLNDRCCSVSMV